MRTTLSIAVVLMASLALGCVHRHDHRDYDRYPDRDYHDRDAHRGHGPPPHAPAHGYRAKHRGHDLQYDSRHGVYVVIGFPGVYWKGGWYYRLWRDRWQRSASGNGPWHDARWGDVPVGLRGGPDEGKGKGHGKKKRKGY